MLTAMDVDKIVSGDFAPDIKKLVSEIEANVGDPAALRAIGARIVADYGRAGLRNVMYFIEITHAEEFSDSEAFDLIVPEPFRTHFEREGFRPMKTKGQIASDRYHEIYKESAFRRKKTTKAEAIARHIAALARLLQDEPGTVVGPILDNLFKRLRADSARKLLGQLK
jgi:hypothetical protein